MAINTTPLVSLEGGAGISQVSDALNAINQGMRNPIAITVSNAASIISYGNELQAAKESGNTDLVEDWYKSLVNRIGRTVDDVREYTPLDLNIMSEPFDYGMILQKLYTFPLESTQNESWGVVDGQEYSPYVVHKLQTAQKLFSGFDTWQLNPTIPDIQLFTAFESAGAMGAFLSSQRQAVAQSRAMYIEALQRLVLANYMAEKIANRALVGVHVIDLLTDYNTKFSQTLTKTAAITDSGFLRYASATISLWIDYISTLGTFFNFERYYRHTPKDRLRVTLLSAFAKLVPFYLQADVYHDNFVALPNYSAVPFWQGTGTDFDFESVSAINMTTSSGTNVNVNGVIGMISDVDAIGMYINKPTTHALYNPRIEVTHEWYKSNVGYFNNFSENAIVFVMGDPSIAPTTTIPATSKVLTTQGIKAKTSAK